MESAIEYSNNPSSNLHQLPAKKRLDLIINHASPLKLVRGMAAPDLLLTIRELGAESSLELVEMMHPGQVQELLDLEIWSRDRLNIKNAGFYFSLLFEANRDTAIAQIHGLDIELIGLMFKTTTLIYDTTLGEEPDELPDLYSITPDRRFIVCFLAKDGYEGLARSLYTFLEELYGRDIAYALRLLESVRFELASGLEEESLRFRRNRLLDLGILPEDERLEYFSPLTPYDMKRVFLATDEKVPWQKAPVPVKTFCKDIDVRHPYLKAALLGASFERQEAFWSEVSHAFINMYATLSGDFGDREHLGQVGDYVKFLLELGLFHRCQGQLAAAASSLEQSSGKYLIRFGRTMLVTMRKRLTEKAKDPSYVFGHNFCHADSPLREVALALSVGEPRFYEELLDVKKLTVRYFSTLTDFNATALAINELIFRGGLVGKIGLDNIAESLKTHKHWSHANILAHCLVNSFLGQGDLLDPIKEETAAKIFEPDGGLTEEFKQAATEFFRSLEEKLRLDSTANAKEISERCQHLLTALLIQFEQNWRLLIG